MPKRRELFDNRRAAGRKLAKALNSQHYNVILALPRGGVPVAYEVAIALKLPLDVVIVRKIGAPGQAEVGLGAVVDGDPPQVVWTADSLKFFQPSERYLEAEVERQLSEITRRRQAYMGNRTSINVSERHVLLVDDGIATGGTAKAAARALRQAGAASVTLAVPVAPQSTLEELANEVDDLVCLASPEPFIAVGLHYHDFNQTSDEEVITLLHKAHSF